MDVRGCSRTIRESKVKPTLHYVGYFIRVHIFHKNTFNSYGCGESKIKPTSTFIDIVAIF